MEGSANLRRVTNTEAAGWGQREETEQEEAIPGPMRESTSGNSQEEQKADEK